LRRRKMLNLRGAQLGAVTCRAAREKQLNKRKGKKKKTKALHKEHNYNGGKILPGLKGTRNAGIPKTRQDESVYSL